MIFRILLQSRRFLFLLSLFCAPIPAISQQMPTTEILSSNERYTVYVYNDPPYTEIQKDIDNKVVIAKMVNKEKTLCIYRFGKPSKNIVALRTLSKIIAKKIDSDNSVLKQHGKMPTLLASYVDDKQYLYTCKKASFIAVDENTQASKFKLDELYGNNHYRIFVINGTDFSQNYNRQAEIERAASASEAETRKSLSERANISNFDTVFSLTLTNHPMQSRSLVQITHNVNSNFWSHRYDDGEGQTCTTQNGNTELLPIRSVSKLLIKNVNRNLVGTGNLTFNSGSLDFFKNVEELYMSYDNNRDQFGNKVRGCRTYIDYAPNMQRLTRALDRTGINYKISSFNSSLSVAQFYGFKRVDDYRFAEKIGANSNQFNALGSFSVSDHSGYLSVLSEAKKSGYPIIDNVESVLIYLQDRSEAVSSGKTANQVRISRNSRQAQDKKAASERMEECLRQNGYYSTNNAAQKQIIARGC